MFLGILALHIESQQTLEPGVFFAEADEEVGEQLHVAPRKFVAIDPDFNAIETVYGMGYRWLA